LPSGHRDSLIRRRLKRVETNMLRPTIEPSPKPDRQRSLRRADRYLFRARFPKPMDELRWQPVQPSLIELFATIILFAAFFAGAVWMMLNCQQ
jgi:hypothetical protein